MFGMLVADDEGIMLEFIKSIIFPNFGSECEAMCAKTERAVVEQAEAFRPDIASVNIRMPGLSGIQTIREVRKFNSSMIFIIITAYDESSYVQETADLGIVELITKPVNKKKVLEVSIRAIWQVEEARQKLSDNLRIKEELELVVPAIESDSIYNLLQDDTDIYRSDYLDILDIRKQYGLMVMLEFGDSMMDGLMTSTVGANIRVDEHYSRLWELVKNYFDCTIGPIMGSRVVLLTSFNSERARYEKRMEVITRTRNMIHKLEGVIDIRSRDDIGTMKPVRDARDFCKEALRALKESDSHVVHIVDISTAADYDGGYPLELEVQYFQRGVKADREGATGCANKFFDWIVAHAGNVRTSIGVKVLELVICLEQRTWEVDCVQYGFRYRENYLNEIQGAGDMNVLQYWFIGKTRKICESISTFRERENENVVSRVKGYIDENFARDISPDDVLQLAGISPYYFSKLLKQKVGENSIKYLTRVRIRHARQLLGDPRYNTKEVYVMCGYSDPNHFSRIFKKYEGKTPSEYKER